MIWHDAYQTISIADIEVLGVLGADEVSLPSIWLIFESFASFRVVEIWRKLIEESAIDSHHLRIICASLEGYDSAIAMFPKSIHSCIILANNWLLPRSMNEGGILIVAQAESGGIEAKLAMIGPPTEEAWDHFMVIWESISPRL